MEQFVEFINGKFGASLGSNVLSIVSAIAILVIGLIIAFVVSKTIGKVLHKTQVDQKLAAWVTGERNSSAVANIEKWVETAVFWLLMLFVIIAFLQALQLSAVSEPINGLLNTIFGFLPQVGGETNSVDKKLKHLETVMTQIDHFVAIMLIRPLQ